MLQFLKPLVFLVSFIIFKLKSREKDEAKKKETNL